MQTATVSYKYRKNHQQEVGDLVCIFKEPCLFRGSENSIEQ